MSDVIGSAFWELDAQSPRLNASLNNAVNSVKRAGTAAESGFATPMDRGLSRVSNGFRNLAGRSEAFRSVITGLGVGAGVSAFSLLETGVRKVVDVFAESITKAKEEQAGIATLTESIRENDRAWDGNMDAIEAVLHARERLGFSDGEQRDSLRFLVAVTKDVTKALGLQRAAMDLARLKGIDLRLAGELLGKVYGGNIGILSRYGIQLAKGTTATEALAEIQRRAAGQAEAYAHTQAGAAEALAAEFENLQEDIGTLLLPALTAVTRLLSEKIVPAFRSAVPVIAQVAGVLGTVLSPVLDHLDTVLLGLVIVLGVRLAAAIAKGIAGLFQYVIAARAAAAATQAQAAASTEAAVAAEGQAAATAATKGALMGLGTAALIAIPIFLSLVDATHDWIVDLELGAANAKALRAGLSDLSLSGIELESVMGGLNKIANEQGRSIDNVIEEFKVYIAQGYSVQDALKGMLDHTIENKNAGDALVESYRQQAQMALVTGRAGNALGRAYADLAGTIRDDLDKALNDTGAMLTQAGPVWAAKLRDGSMVYATSAQELADKLPKAQQAALDAAKEIAKRSPYEIAKSFREGEDAVYQAALALGEQQTHAQDLTNQIIQKQAELASKELAKQLRSADPATRAAAQSQANQLRREIFALRAQLDPKAALASKALADALQSNDPETRRWAQALANALQDELDSQLPAVQRIADEYGLTLPDALKKYRDDAGQSADAQAQSALDALIEKHRAFTGAGFTAGENFGDGIAAPANKTNARTKGGIVAGAARGGMDSGWYAAGQTAAYQWIAGLGSESALVRARRQAAQLKGAVVGVLEFSGSPAWTHIRALGTRAAREWANALGSEASYASRHASRLRRAASSAMDAGGGSAASLAMALQAAQAAAVTSNGRGDVHVHLHVEGGSPAEPTVRDLFSQLGRATYFTDRTLANLRGG